MRQIGIELELEIPIDEVVFLQSAEPFADLAGSHCSDAFDGLELSLRGPDHRIEASEIGHDPTGERLRQAWDVRKGPIAARHDGLVATASVRLSAALCLSWPAVWRHCP